MVVEGSGIRISWSDNTIDQYIWYYNGSGLALRDSRSGSDVSAETVSNILSSFTGGFASQSLWSHLFGVSGEHISASAQSQIDDVLPQNTWVRLIYDEAQIDSHSGGITMLSNGIIQLNCGEWIISGNCQIHKTGGSSVNIMIQLWDEDNLIEIPRTFYIKSTDAKNNSPELLYMHTAFDTEGILRNISVRIRSDSSDTHIGAAAASIPVGSTNSAGLLVVHRIG